MDLLWKVVHYGRSSFILSWLKFLFAVVLSLATNRDYLLCGTSGTRSCASTPSSSEGCSKHGLADDAYLVANDDPSGGCQVIMDASSVCNSWVAFTLTVLVANALHFVYQLHCFRNQSSFDPISDVYLAIENDQWNLLVNYGLRYKITIISFLELLVITISWGAVGIGVQCGDYEQIQEASIVAFDFALAMMAVETYKINVSLAMRHWTSIRYAALLYLFRVDLTIVNTFVIGVHGVAFVVFVIYDFCSYLYRCGGLVAASRRTDEGRLDVEL